MGKGLPLGARSEYRRRIDSQNHLLVVKSASERQPLMPAFTQSNEAKLAPILFNDFEKGEIIAQTQILTEPHDHGGCGHSFSLRTWRCFAVKRRILLSGSFWVVKTEFAWTVRMALLNFGRNGVLSVLLMIDNYDSFTYNVVQYLGELGADVQVYRNDAISIDEIESLNPTQLVISPGPCTPKEAGISMQVIRHFGGKVPLLGICLGHQSIGQVYGGEVVRAKKVMHGKLSPIHHSGKGVFRDLAEPFTATRYHSLVVDALQLPDCLEVTAWTENENGGREEIMGVRHKELAVEGVQFHPESILSEHGHALLKNFLDQN